MTQPGSQRVCPDSLGKTHHPSKAEFPEIPGVQSWQLVQTSEARDTLHENAGYVGRADPDTTGKSPSCQHFGNTY